APPSPQAPVPTAEQPLQSAATSHSRPVRAVLVHVRCLPHPPKSATPTSLLQNVFGSEVAPTVGVCWQVPPPVHGVLLLHGAPAFVPRTHQPLLLQIPGLAQPRALTLGPPGVFAATR